METPQTAGTNATTNTAHPRELQAFNKEFLAELDETDDVVRAARKSAYAPKLATKYLITTAFVDSLATRSAQARTLLGNAQTGRDTSHAATDDKQADEDALIAAIRDVQTGARLKYDGDKPNLRRYFIGTQLQSNESRLQQIATTILENLTHETLPGVDADEVTALQNALDEWIADANTQSDSGTAAGLNYDTAVAMLKEIKRDRRKIQIAANGMLPYTNPLNAAPRGEFHLPPKRPFV